MNCSPLLLGQRMGILTTKLSSAAECMVVTRHTWYDVYVRACGGTIEVWRGLRGQKLYPVGQVATATVLSGGAVALDTSANTVAHFDDIRMCVPRTDCRSFTSAFDGTLDGWVQDVPGTFSATDNYLKNTVSTATVKMRRDTANADFQMKFWYRDTSSTSGPEAQIQYRWADGSHCGLLRLSRTSCRVSENRGGTVTDLATTSWSTAWGAWYEVTVIADGAHIEVWRGLTGTAPARVCSVDNATLLSGSRRISRWGPAARTRSTTSR